MTDPRIAFYGGSFDPPHNGHLQIAEKLLEQFRLDEFVFIPAFHAPHKTRQTPTAAYDRYAMLCLATQYLERISVSRIEIEMPGKPYSYETLTRLTDMLPRAEIFFVMGADSWADIRTWREWEKLLLMTNHIVMTRPGYEISFDHVTEEVRERIVDLRATPADPSERTGKQTIFITDTVMLDLSATSIRKRIRDDDDTWRRDVPVEVANYIEKYQIYR